MNKTITKTLIAFTIIGLVTFFFPEVWVYSAALAILLLSISVISLGILGMTTGFLTIFIAYLFLAFLPLMLLFSLPILIALLIYKGLFTKTCCQNHNQKSHKHDKLG